MFDFYKISRKRSMLMNYVKDFRKLNVAKRIRLLCHRMYEISYSLSSHESNELGGQLRRAMDSVYLNLAEGNGQLYIKKEVQFLSVAIGSISEVKACIDLIYDREYINEVDFRELDEELTQITKILFSMYKKIKENLNYKILYY